MESMDVYIAKMQESSAVVRTMLISLTVTLHQHLCSQQAQTCAKTVRSSCIKGKMKEKDEWRFATMDYGGQCVTMAGMKWMQMLSVLSLDMDIQVRIIC